MRIIKLKFSIFFPFIFLFIFSHFLHANDDPYPKNPKIDVINYIFDIKLSDKSDEIICDVLVDLRFLETGIKKIRFDLEKSSQKTENKGMTVLNVRSGENSLEFLHEENELWIYMDKVSIENERKKIIIQYKGIPAEGLKIANNKYGDRTFLVTIGQIEQDIG
jgi:hypothetical protein